MHPLSSIPVFPANVAVHNTPADRVNTEDGLLQPINIHKFVLRHGKLLYTFRHSRKRREAKVYPGGFPETFLDCGVSQHLTQGRLNPSQRPPREDIYDFAD